MDPRPVSLRGVQRRPGKRETDCHVAALLAMTRTGMLPCPRAADSRPYEGNGKRAVESAGPYDAEIPDIAVGATLAVARWLRRVPPYIVAVGDAALGVPFSRSRDQA